MPQPGDGVRFVDMQRCFDAYGPIQQEMERLRDALNRSREEFAAREQSLKEQEGELAPLDPNSEEFQQRVYALESSKLMLERDMQYRQASLNVRRLELFLRSYDEVQKAAAQLAATSGWGALLVVPTTPEALGDQDLAARVQTLQNRAVLFSNPTYDVTDQLIAILRR